MVSHFIPNICLVICTWYLFCFPCSHDFIGDFTTSYRELARGQSQFNVYEVSDSSVCTVSVQLWINCAVHNSDKSNISISYVKFRHLPLPLHSPEMSSSSTQMNWVTTMYSLLRAIYYAVFVHDSSDSTSSWTFLLVLLLFSNVKI